MSKGPKDRIEEAETARSLMVPKAVRNTEKEFFVTGFTFKRMMVSIDVFSILEHHIMMVFDRNPGRALRMVDHIRGKRIGLFPWRHRIQLHEDMDNLGGALRKGGYPSKEKG